MNSHELFTNTPPRKLFFFAALPGAVSMLASALYQLFDGMFVGQFLGSTPFAALNLAMPFVIINFALADLIGVGSSVPISIHLGRHEDNEASNYFTCASILIVLAGVVVGAAIYAAAPMMIALMGAEGEFASLAVSYLRVYGLCSPVTTIVFAVDNFLRICGKTRGSMFLNIFMSVLSVALEAFFLLVLRLGIAGAALGTCLGMAVTAVVAYIPFFRGRMLLRFRRPRFSRAMIRKIVTSGAPNFLNNIAGRITSILMNVLLVRLGGEIAVSIYGVLIRGGLYPAASVRHVRFSAARRGLQLGGARFSARQGHRKVLLCRRGGHLASFGAGHQLHPRGHRPRVHGGRERLRHRRHRLRPAPVQPDVSYALVLLRHAELHAGHRARRRGDADLPFHGADLPAAAHRRALAAGLDGAVAQLRRHIGAGGHTGGLRHAAPEARLESVDSGAPRGVQRDRLSRSQRHSPPHSMALCGGFLRRAEVSVCVSPGNWCLRSPSAWG